MFEGLVQNLLLGYLGSYIKNIQKEQLKIGPWDGEVKLHNLELNLDAFDNLLLPFSLKQGQIGTLSIKIPWKKLGWDPIEIFLDKVFVCACQRDDSEWSSDSVERREFAAKKAKLHAAEMAKPFVSENKTWQSFIPHITAKILDGIQVSITEVHFIYTNKQSDAAPCIFGLRFSSLKLERNIRSYSGKVRGAEVNKTMMIKGLEIYCNASLERTINNVSDPHFFFDARVKSNEFDILEPCDVTVHLVVNRSGQLKDGVPQYSIGVELTTVTLRLNEIQMQQILTSWDYLGTCHLREKYGRFLPCRSTLCSKPKGWQKMWWHYAQESVLSDIRKRLRRFSWRYLGWRISYRRKYVNLYQKKLNFIRQAQPVDRDILLELEQMERESDIDDILTYRSIAERESQAFLLSSMLPTVGKYTSNVAAGGEQMDESSSSGGRGWINWLSLGMLGAGGAEDSIQFSGVVSDEIVKDIYEVTQFHPVSSLDGGALTKNGIYLFSIKFNVHQINAILLSMAHEKEIVKVILDEVNMVFKLWEESWHILMSVNPVQMEDLCTGSVILRTTRGSTKDNFITFEVDMSSVNHEPEFSIKAVFEPFEVTYESQLLLNVWDFFVVLESFQFQSTRVLSSLNRLESDKVRLLSKAEYIFSNRTNVLWDARFTTIITKVPWRHENSEHIMVMEFGPLHFRTRSEVESLGSSTRDQISICSTKYSDTSLGFQLDDLYNHFEFVLTSLEINVMLSDCRQVSLVDRCSASLNLASCIIPDESMLEQLKVHFTFSPLHIHFSPSIYGALVDMYSCLEIPELKSESATNERKASSASNFGISGDLKCVSFHVETADEVENSIALMLAFGDAYIRCAYQEIIEYWICTETLQISTCTLGDEKSSTPLCSSRILCSRGSIHQYDIDGGIDPGSSCARNESGDSCFVLHYQAQRSVPMDCQKYSIYLNDLDLHIYPNIVGLLLRFFDRLSSYGTTSSPHSCSKSEIKENIVKSFVELHKFGFSNLYRDLTTASEGIPLNHFPFVTICNSDSLSGLKQSLMHVLPVTSRNFTVRDGKSVRSVKCSLRRGSRVSSVPNLKPLTEIDLYPAHNGSYGADLHVLDLNLSGIEVYFHDSSSLLATLTLPLCKSSFIIEGTRCLDILCSVDGLLLSSSWASKDFGEFLWGNSVPNLPPVLNIRLRKNNVGALNKKFEISIGVQHVCCVLPSEFLAILIGYFSLPAWSPCGHEKLVTENHKQSEDDKNGVLWKVEILDSKLILPVENRGQSLHLGLQQLYFSFTTVNNKEDALKDIPLDCMVPVHKVADTVRLLNIFGRDLCLSLTLLKDEGKVSEKLVQAASHGDLSIISSIDLDLWIRIPCDSKSFGGLAASTCIMTKVDNCQVIAEDDIFLFGVEAMLTVIGDLLTVDKESEGFQSDVLQFLQLKKILKQSNFVSPDTSCVTFTEIRCSVNSLSIKSYRSRRRGSVPSELVASANMKFQVSASFRNECPLSLNVGFSSLALHSFHSRVILVHCASDASGSKVLDIHFAKSHGGVNELVIDLPSVHIWFHLPDWCKASELLVSYSEQLTQTSLLNTSSNGSNSAPSELKENEMTRVYKDRPESPRLSSSTCCTNFSSSSDLIVRSDNIGVSLHYPLLVNEKAFSSSMEAEINLEIPCDFTFDINGEAAMVNQRHCQYVTLILHGRNFSLAINERHAKLDCSLEEVRGMLHNVKDERVFSSSIFQLFQVHVVAIYDKQNKQHVSAAIQVDSLDISASHHLFYIWHGLGYRSAETGPSQYSIVSMDLKMQIRKASVLLTDWTCSCNGPILEILLRNLVIRSDTTKSSLQASLASDFTVNHFNIQKVTWEPFVETWNFVLNMNRTHKHGSSLNTSVMTDIHLTSTTQLNMNLTVPIIEVLFRVNELIKDEQGLVRLNDRILGVQTNDIVYTSRYAPCTLQNDTSLPLQFQVHRGLVNEDDLDLLSVKEGNILYPGSSVCIYTDESPEEQVLRFRPPQSSDRLDEKKSYGVTHRMISIQLDGTSEPSRPISMDIVGLSYFEVNFSKALGKEAVERNEDALDYERKSEEKSMGVHSGFVVPVVFDVATLHYRKLIRVYSTVILLNTTSTTLELRFDTPFGVSPKVLDQITPGQEFPLPLHLAQAGRIRWRPLNSSFRWSEAHMLSKVLSQETKLGSFRSFVCYPSHRRSDPFRCCLSIQIIKLASASGHRDGSSIPVKDTLRHSFGNDDNIVYSRQNSKTPSIHYLTLTTPLLVRNYMPKEVLLTVESGGGAHTLLVSEVDCASIFHIDSSHDLGLVFQLDGFRNSISKFPRAEAFAAVARFHENKFSQSETVMFYSDSSNGPIHVTVEKTMDAFSGARELCIFVPFLLYNCTGLQITVADVGHEMEGCTMAPCVHLIEKDKLFGRTQSPILQSSKWDAYATAPNIDNVWNSSTKSRSISFGEDANLRSERYSRRHVTSTDPSAHYLDHSSNHDLGGTSLDKRSRKDIINISEYSERGEYMSGLVDIEGRKVRACMYFPHSSSSESELMVRLSICTPKYFTDSKKSSMWSSPFYLVPASGSTCVIVPQTNTSGAFIVSVTSSPLSGPFSGRTKAITFQPRYVISNQCNKDLCYKQKGSDSVFHLETGQHSHLHWADLTRELLVSLVFNEPGWLWSGSFFPDHLGDTQVKMRNYVHGTLSVIRVEVQNADVAITDEKIVGSPNGNSGALLILLSDDDTGFMPYRIDNFSKERLRIYQEKCKTFETTIHSYMSCPYTWDEPCYPHCLVVEVLGERILGSYSLDDVTEETPIYLPSTSEKPSRQLVLSIHADGAVKVLSIIDSSYIPKDVKDCGFSGIKEKRRFDQKEDIFVDYCERISAHIPFIGVSLINSYPQELLFASAIDTRIDVLQSLEQQKFSFQISLLQVDNQLHNTAYPVILSLDHDYGGNLANQMKNKDDNLKMKNDIFLDIASAISCQPTLLVSAVKWRNKEISLVSFEYIILRLAALRLELEEEFILCCFDFIRSMTSKMHTDTFPCSDSNDTGSIKGFPGHAPHYESLSLNRGQRLSMSVSKCLENCRSNSSLLYVVPIEDFWQQIYFVARRQNKIYVEEFILAPIKLTLSFSSAPWMRRNEGHTSAEYPRFISGTAFQRGLMALADVEGAPVYLKQLTIAHHMGTSQSFNEILIRHYTPQLLHEMYKIFGSASVIGNPMGFAKNLGLGIKDFLSVPATGILKSPSGLFTGMAQGTTSLFYSTVYAMSNAATQFSKSVHKSIVAFTFDDQALLTMEKQWTSLASHGKGVLNEFLEGLTGFLQSPIQGAERHGLPGFVSGVALGTAGLVARPVASILEVTGKTAQSIRNRSRLHRSHRFRVRIPRPLSRELPLQPYSLEEAIGISILMEADDIKLKDEIFVTCRTLKQRGKFLIITKRFVLVVTCSSLVGYGTPEVHGVADHVIEFAMSLKNVIYVGREVEQINIVGMHMETPLKQRHHKMGIRRTKWWSLLPLFQMTSIEFGREEAAADALQILVSTIKQRKEQGFGGHVLHRTNLG